MRHATANLTPKMRGAAHDSMRDAVWRIVALAAEGHPGAKLAVGRVTACFLAEMERRTVAGITGARTAPESLFEINAAVIGAVAKVAGGVA
jgi:hypothetical protein